MCSVSSADDEEVISAQEVDPHNIRTFVPITARKSTEQETIRQSVQAQQFDRPPAALPTLTPYPSSTFNPSIHTDSILVVLCYHLCAIVPMYSTRSRSPHNVLSMTERRQNVLSALHTFLAFQQSYGTEQTDLGFRYRGDPPSRAVCPEDLGVPHPVESLAT